MPAGMALTSDHAEPWLGCPSRAQLCSEVCLSSGPSVASPEQEEAQG